MNSKVLIGVIAMLCVSAISTQAYATCAVMCSVTPIEKDCSEPPLLNDMCKGDPKCVMSEFAKNWGWSTDKPLQVTVSCETVCCAPGQCSDPSPTEPKAAELFIDQDGAAVAGAFSAVENSCDGDVFAFDQSLDAGQYTLRYESELFGKVIVEKAPELIEDEADDGGCQHTNGRPSGAIWLVIMGVGLWWRRRR